MCHVINLDELVETVVEERRVCCGELANLGIDPMVIAVGIVNAALIALSKTIVTTPP